MGKRKTKQNKTTQTVSNVKEGAEKREFSLISAAVKPKSHEILDKKTIFPLFFEYALGHLFWLRLLKEESAYYFPALVPL